MAKEVNGAWVGDFDREVASYSLVGVNETSNADADAMHDRAIKLIISGRE